MDENIKLKDKLLFPEEYVDDLAEKVVELLGRAKPIKKIRKSGLVTAVFGAIGFSLFTLGIGKIFVDLPGGILVIIGVVFMVVSGLLIQNFWR